jgi:hypothetical protein
MSLFFELLIERREREAKQAARKTAGRALVNYRRDRGYTLLTRPETERDRRAMRRKAREADQWVREQVARELAEIKRLREEREKIIDRLYDIRPGNFDGSIPYRREERRRELIELAKITTLSLNEFFEKNLTPAERRRLAA